MVGAGKLVRSCVPPFLQYRRRTALPHELKAAGETKWNPNATFSIPEEAWVSLSADEGQGSSNSQDTTDSVGVNSPGSVCVHACVRACVRACVCVCVCACTIVITQVRRIPVKNEVQLVSFINYPCTLYVVCTYVLMEK